MMLIPAKFSFHNRLSGYYVQTFCFALTVSWQQMEHATSFVIYNFSLCFVQPIFVYIMLQKYLNTQVELEYHLLIRYTELPHSVFVYWFSSLVKYLILVVCIVIFDSLGMFLNRIGISC